RYFVVAAEELHFHRAALRLNVSQPTLTQQIRRLESQIGAQLLIRSTRRVELTPAGLVFLEHSRKILQHLDEALLSTRLEAGNVCPGGDELIIGVISPASRQLLPLTLSRFRSRFPSTRLVIKEIDSTGLCRALEKGEIHVGLMRPPANANMLRFRHLYSERFVAVIPKRSALARKPSLKLSDMRGHEVFALKRFDLKSFEEVWNKLSSEGLIYGDNLTVSDTTAAIALVASGAGTTFLPEWVSAGADPNVVVRFVEDLTETIPMVAGWNPDCVAPGILPFVEYSVLASSGLGEDNYCSDKINS
ncbi:LysR family transcriptional regulator, partial [Pantoea endophytica]